VPSRRFARLARELAGDAGRKPEKEGALTIKGKWCVACVFDPSRLVLQIRATADSALSANRASTFGKDAQHGILDLARSRGGYHY